MSDDELFTPDGDLVGAEEAALIREEYDAACESGDISASEMQFGAYAASWFTGCAPPMCTGGTAVVADATSAPASSKPGALVMADAAEAQTDGIFDDVVDAVEDGASDVVDEAGDAFDSAEDEASNALDDVVEDVFGVAESETLSAASMVALSAEVADAADALDGGDARVARRHYGGSHVVQQQKVMRALAKTTATTFATSYDSSSSSHAADVSDSGASAGISFVQQLRAREQDTDTGSDAGAYPYATTANSLLEDMHVVSAYATSARALASALSDGDSVHRLGVELYATLGGLEGGDVDGFREDALGSGAAACVLDPAALSELAASPGDCAIFVECATAMAGAFSDGGGVHDAAMGLAMADELRASPARAFTQVGHPRAASSASCAITYESLPVGALTDRFTSRMDKAWGGFVREIVKASASKNVEFTPRSLNIRTALAFKDIFGDLTRTKAKTPESDIRRVHLTLSPIATQLMRVAGEKLHQYTFAGEYREVLAHLFRAAAFDAVGSPFDSLRTEFTFRGKVKKGLAIIMTRAAKGASAADIAAISASDTKTFLAPFIERRTADTNDGDNAKSKLDVAALFVTVAAGIVLHTELRRNSEAFLNESDADVEASNATNTDTLSIIETGVRSA